MSLERIGLKLTNISRALECEGSEEKRCHLVSSSHHVVSSSHRELQAAREALDKVVQLSGWSRHWQICSLHAAHYFMLIHKAAI